MRHSFVAAAVLALLLTACGGCDGDSPDEPEPTEDAASLLQSAYNTCSPAVEAGIRQVMYDDDPPLAEVFSIDEAGESIVISHPNNATHFASVAADAALCVLEETDAPSSILADLRTSTLRMGRQSADYDNVVVTWSLRASGGAPGGFQATFDES